MKKYFKATTLLSTLCSGLCFQPLAHGATSLHQALVSTYHTNPTLAAKRDEMAATDSLRIRGYAEFLPSVSLQGSKKFDQFKDRYAGVNQNTDALSKSLNASLDVFNGGGSLAQFKSYSAKIAAKAADLKATEQAVLLKGIKAYLDLWTKKTNLEVSEKAEKVYAETLTITLEKLKHGVSSQADVERARSEYQKIKSRLLASQSDLQAAIANYENITGLPYGGVESPVMLMPAPEKMEDVQLVATVNNPSLIVADRDVDDANALDTLAKTKFSPRVSVDGALSYTNQTSRPADPANPSTVSSPALTRSFDRSVTATLRIPLFQQGVEYAQVKEASNTLAQKKQMRRQTQQDLFQGIQSTWTAWLSSAAQVQSYSEGVKAATFLKESVRQEYNFGIKTLFDVYQAEKDLLDAEYALIEARRSEFASAYDLLNLMGKLTGEELKLAEQKTSSPPVSPSIEPQAAIKKINIGDFP